MKAQRTVIAVIAAGLISVAGFAGAQAHDGGRGDWHHGEGMEFLQGLNLTDAQKQQAHEIMQAGHTQAHTLMQQAHALHEQIVTQLLTAGTTADQIQPLVTQEEQLRAQMDTAHLNMAIQLRGVLTPEQLTQAAATHQKLEALHEQEHEVMGQHDGDQ
jgi:Spy/CpxP family protein refolding chaperone